MDNNKLSDPYVVLRMVLDRNEKTAKKWRSNVVKETLDPVWNEGTSFDVPSGKEKSIKVFGSVFDHDSFGRDHMGDFSFDLEDVVKNPEKYTEAWLDVVLKGKSGDRDGGRVLLQVSYLSAKDMEGPKQYVRRNFDSLLEILYQSDEWFSVVAALSFSYRSDAIAAGIVTCCLRLDCLQACLHSLIKREVAQTVQESTLFRTDSTCTKVIRSLMRQTALGFARDVCSEPVLKILEDPGKFNPHPKEGEDAALVEEARNGLFSLCDGFLDKIEEKAKDVPTEVLGVFSILRVMIGEAFPNSILTCIGGFFFLRFLCPAILSPESVEITAEAPQKEGRQVLTVFSKLVQCMSNRTLMKKDKGKEVSFLNEYVEKNTPRVQAVLERLCKLPTAIDTPKKGKRNIYFSKAVGASISSKVVKELEPVLVLFIQCLCDNYKNCLKMLKDDPLVGMSLVSPESVSEHCNIVTSMKKDIDNAHQVAGFKKKISVTNLLPKEAMVVESTAALVSVDEVLFTPGSISVSNMRVMITTTFFEMTKTYFYSLACVKVEDDTEASTLRIHVKLPRGARKSHDMSKGGRERKHLVRVENGSLVESLQKAIGAEGKDDKNLEPVTTQGLLRDECLRLYDWEQLQALATFTEYDPGAVICTRDKRLEGFYQIVDGSVDMVGSSAEEGGCTKVLSSVQAPELFGLVAFMECTPAKSDVVAGPLGATLLGFNGGELLFKLRQDHTLACKFYNYVAVMLGKQLTTLTSKAAKQPRKDKDKADKDKAEKKKGPTSDTIAVYEARLSRRRDAPGHFYVYANHAHFISKLFGRKVEITIHYSAVKAKTTSLIVVNMKGKTYLQVKMDDSQHMFKMDDPSACYELIMEHASKSSSRRQSISPALSTSSDGMSDHETMSSTDWDVFLNYGSRTVKFKRDETCLKEGEAQNDLFQITSGSVRIEKNGQVVAKLPTGAIFGELSFLSWYSTGENATASANVVADSKKVEMLVLEGQYISGALAKNSRLGSSFFVYLSHLLIDRFKNTLDMLYS